MYRYTGAGRYALGVPARDLSDDEWNAISDADQAVAAALYEYVDGDLPSDTPATDDAPAEQPANDEAPAPPAPTRKGGK